MTSAAARACVVRLTGAGRAAVASLLVDGEQAVQVVEQLFTPAGRRRLGELPSGRIVFGRWLPGEIGEEVVVCRRQPAQVEIHCHGGQAAAGAIVRSLVAHGCRELEWPDWIRQSTVERIAAEARIALAGATTERTALVLNDQLCGALERAILAIDADVQAGQTGRAIEQIDALLRWWPLGRHLASPWQVVLAGRPNVGKSSLINALVGYQRAIVHATPGTTRDVVTARAAVDGWPIELADTAGIRAGGESLEAAGIELARRRLAAADLVLLVFDSSQQLAEDDELLLAQWPGALRVANKCDLDRAAAIEAAVSTSATSGAGIDRLAAAVAARLVPQPPQPGQAMPFVAWQVEALEAARSALEREQNGPAAAELANFRGASWGSRPSLA